jgi:hypothetical protein
MSGVRISVQAAALDAMVKYLDRIPVGADKALRKVVAHTAMTIEGTAKVSIQRGPKTGRLYRTSNKRKMHQASAPGEAPATDTGTLVARINHQVIDSGLEASVFSDVSYAGYLERGTKRMAPRPYIMPAAEKARPDFERDIDLAIAGVIK